jgi:hypothetical protein
VTDPDRAFQIALLLRHVINHAKRPLLTARLRANTADFALFTRPFGTVDARLNPLPNTKRNPGFECSTRSPARPGSRPKSAAVQSAWSSPSPAATSESRRTTRWGGH